MVGVLNISLNPFMDEWMGNNSEKNSSKQKQKNEYNWIKNLFLKKKSLLLCYNDVTANWFNVNCVCVPLSSGANKTEMPSESRKSLIRNHVFALKAKKNSSFNFETHLW